MARRKVTNRVPPVRPTRRAGSIWDQTFLGDNRYGEEREGPRRSSIPNQGSFGDSTTIRSGVRQNTDILTQQEIQLALLGDDSKLLPYQPTPTINPGRPRTLAAGYDERTMTLRVKFREGEIYEYYNVPPSVWYKFQRVSSPGRFINTTLNHYPYHRGLL